MTEPEIEAFERKLDDVLSKIRGTNDPEQKRTLLKEMRMLMAKLDQLIFDNSRFPRP